MKIDNISALFKEKQILVSDYCSELSETIVNVLFSKKVATIGFILFFLAITVAIYMMNLHTTLVADDYGYSFSRVTGKPVVGIIDIIYSQYIHYFKWGGRSITHSLAQFFLMHDKVVFNICNTLAFSGLLVVICLHAVGRFKFSPGLIISATGIFFCFMRHFGQVFLWVTGACNYLWGPLIVLIYLLPYRFQLNSKEPLLSNKLLIVIYFFSGIIAGWTNENMAVALVVMSMLFILYYLIKNGALYTWSISGFFGSLIGAFILISAPGNFIRAGHGELNILENIGRTMWRLFNTNFIFCPLLLALALYLFSSRKNDITWILIYFLGMLVSLCAMILSPGFPKRAESGILFLMTIVVCALYENLEFDNDRVKKLSLLIATVMLFCVINNFVTGYRDIKAYEARHLERIKYVIAEKAKGNFNLVLRKNEAATRYCAASGLEDIRTNSKFWANTGFARYFGLKTVRIKNE